jgi:predicted dienelactone hydrolase
VELPFWLLSALSLPQPISQLANGRSVTKRSLSTSFSRDNRPVAVDIAVRRDKQMQANAGMIRPVAVFNHGNTVKNTGYSFLANLMAARGYEVISIQRDLPTDPPMVTKVGELYVERLTQIQRGVANIRFALEQMMDVQPNADYDHLTVVGHSMGGDISVYLSAR